MPVWQVNSLYYADDAPFLDHLDYEVTNPQAATLSDFQEKGERGGLLHLSLQVSLFG